MPLIVKFTLIVGLLFTFNTHAAEQINPVKLTVQKRTIEYGKSVKIEIKTLAKENINIPRLLKPLKKKFLYSITDRIKDKQYILHKIKLLPLQEGMLLIPSLHYKQYKTQPVNITVTSPLSKNNQAILVKLKQTNSTPWVREQVRIVATIITTDKNIILNNKNIIQKGSESYLIPQSTRKVIINDRVFYEHKTGWNLFFLYNQKVNLDLPAIEYIKDGVPRYKFHFQKIKINIRKLPVYVSPTIPVGKLSLTARYLELPKTLLQPGMTAIIQYSLIGKRIPAKWLPSLSQKYTVIHNPEINFSPIRTNLTTQIVNTDITGNKISDIAFTPYSNGQLPVQNIQLQYFDPETGLLKSIVYQHSSLLVLHWILQLILLVIIVSAMYFLITKTVCFTTQWFKRYRHRVQSRTRINHAETFSDIQLALQDFSLAENWPVNITLNQWLYRVQNKYKTPGNLQEICDSLNQSLYAMGCQSRTAEVEAMKTSLLDILKQLKKKRWQINRYLNRKRFSLACFSQQG